MFSLVEMYRNDIDELQKRITRYKETVYELEKKKVLSGTEKSLKVFLIRNIFDDRRLIEKKKRTYEYLNTGIGVQEDWNTIKGKRT